VAPPAWEPLRSGGQKRASDPVLALNHELDRITTGRLINESAIETWLDRLQADVSANDSRFWLLMARLAELAIVCAGRYADGCEFAAAGDLLVNPRQIRVHFFGDTPPEVKHRRGALSTQFNAAGLLRDDFIRWFRQAAAVEIVKTPLLTFFTEMLATSGAVQGLYLENLSQRVDRIAETLGFLNSWQVNDVVDFHRRLDAATPETRHFVRSHLCRFDLDLFTDLGRDVLNLTADPMASSLFLAPASHPLRSGKMRGRYQHA